MNVPDDAVTIGGGEMKKVPNKKNRQSASHKIKRRPPLPMTRNSKSAKATPMGVSVAWT